ncbi:MAG: 2-dehydropantoate 2-reductase N-terminal domain-containing protein, partial [Acidobacteriaceae bacterium]
MSNIAVMGAGAWGTALALNLAQRGGHSVTLWAHDPAVAETIRTSRENAAALPGFPFPSSIAATSSAAEALEQAEIVVSVM